jgi:hypothetical protein
MIWNFPLGRDLQAQLREKIESKARAEGVVGE